MSGRRIRGVEESPVGLESSIGWVLIGPRKSGGRSHVMHAGVSVEERLDDHLGS